MDNNSDRIELILPFKPEYVSIARLTVSGIANRMGFDIETIEDIKVAVAEVCNKLIKVGSICVNSFKVVFDIKDNELSIAFQCHDETLKCIFGDKGDEFGVSIINALMDDVEMCTKNEYILIMSKSV